MITDLSYEEFCNKYYLDARRSADYVVADFIKKKGNLDPSIDQVLIKDVAITLCLQKAYNRFDSEHSKGASVKTYLSNIIHNQLMTELGKEGRAVGAGKKKSLDATDGKDAYKGGDISTDDNGEAAHLKLQLAACVEKLDPVMRTIIDCWMDNERTYCNKALSILGWGAERRREVKKLRAKAYSQLCEMMKVEKPVEKKTEKPESASFAKNPEDVVYTYDIPLKNLKGYVEYIKEYFGLEHPSLPAELSLLEVDPERLYKLYEFVLHENIETAFAEGKFTCGEDERRIHVDFLWLVANLYHRRVYDLYQDHFNDLASEDLIWKEVREDILSFYAFMKGHTEKAPITITVGKKDKVVIKDSERWFQALMENHLFPKTIPEIESQEQALEVLKKNPGRKVENKLAVAIINGVATYFADNELVKGRAPKNLCSFIRQYLILMDILDVNDTVISEASIKSAIDYAAKKKTDPRLPTVELQDESLEDLANQGFIPGERWLFTKEI